MSNKDFTLIQQYYNLELGDAELQAFESRMQRDEVFSQQVLDFHESQHFAKKHYETKEELEREKSWQQTKTQTPSNTRTLPTRYLKLAASVLILIGIWSLVNFFTNSEKEKWESLLVQANEAVPPLNYHTLRSSNLESTEELIVDGYDLLLEKNYADATVLFSKVPSSDQYYADALLLGAICNFKIGDYHTSLNLLAQLESINNSSQVKHLLWYKCLNYLELKELDKARFTLNQLTTGDRKESVNELIRLIDQLNEK